MKINRHHFFAILIILALIILMLVLLAKIFVPSSTSISTPSELSKVSTSSELSKTSTTSQEKLSQNNDVHQPKTQIQTQNKLSNVSTSEKTFTLSERQKYLLSQPALSKDIKIDKLVVYKSKREMQAYANGKLVKTYPIALGRNPVGHKRIEGDKKTPEGIYYINDRNPNSAFHKNLGVSYPNQKDKDYAKSIGKSAGGDIKIHGIKNGFGKTLGEKHLLKDWTDGCIAVTNREMDELFIAVKHNAVIDIRP